MWGIRQRREPEVSTLVLTLAAGAVGGFAAGVLVSALNRPVPVGAVGGGLRDRARSAAARLAPERRYRLVGEQAELEALEDAVLDAFLGDSVLGERGIDVGAISSGIIELSGSVHTEQEADRAVHVAGSVAGVETVVDRMEIEEEVHHLELTRRRLADEDPALTDGRWEGRRVGMGRMRQGAQTEPDRPDDSQKLAERALERADRDEWVSGGFAAVNPRTSARPEELRSDTWYEDDELDNQDPHDGNHASLTLNEQPQELHSSARVGEPPKPGTELRLEQADVPVKPHGKGNRRKDEEEAES